jgi:YD repeat-containing protein
VTTHVYDGLDREVVMTDAAGRKMRTEYFKDGKTKRITRAYQSTMMPAIVYATYTPTPNGQIDTVTDANGNITNLDYDGFDRLARTFFPDPSSGAPCLPVIPHSSAPPSCGANQKYEELGYDPAGNITSKRNRSGAVITYVFDDLNRETTHNVPANSLGHFARTLTNTFDLAGRKYDATADGQTISHRYDAAGWVDFVTDSYLAPTGTTDYGYDAAGNRTTLVYPGGTTVAYTYDALNRMDTVTEGGVQLADYDWDVLSRRDLTKLNNNAFSMDYAYEDDDDLATLAHTGPAPVTYTLGRNQVGQITSLAVTDGAFLSRPPTNATDAYAANRLNQISTLNAAAFAYDANGNLTSDGTLAFEYDEENRLRAASGPKDPAVCAGGNCFFCLFTSLSS